MTVVDEFVRTPMIWMPGTENVGLGRDRNPPGYYIPLADRGVCVGQLYSGTKGFGCAKAAKPVDLHALHAATISHLACTRSTHGHSGKNSPSTDVHCRTIREWVA